MKAQIVEKLNLFDSSKFQVVCSGASIILAEKKSDGKAAVNCICNRESLVILKPEENVLRYLDGQIKGATKCADVFVFTPNEENWDLHVMEFKKTINTQSYRDSKWQFKMGIYNARAIAGFLGMQIKTIYVYSAFRKDDIEKIPESALITIRAKKDEKINRMINEWKENVCEISLDLEKKTLELHKIQLDEKGQGVVRL